MKYLLDTNMISDFYNTDSEYHKKILERMSSLVPGDIIQVSVLSLYELEYGFMNAPENKKKVLRKRIEKISKKITILPVSKKGARCFGELKKSIKEHWGIQENEKITKESMKKLNIDLVLASTAILRSCIFVSNDKLFAELASLRPDFIFENWIQK